MKRISALIMVAVFLPLLAFAQEQTVVRNFGFIQGNIWYSKDPFFGGDKIRIYTGVFNGSGEDIIGSVEFFDNEQLIGRTEFSAVGGGKLREVWLDWTATEGNHIISAKIVESKISKAGGDKEDVTPQNNRSGQDVRFVDIDTDKDGAGNREDTDDDNDGVSDLEEKKAGTDPLKADTDDDGYNDKEDPDPLVKNERENPIASTTQKVVKNIAEKTPNVILAAVEAVNDLADKGVEALEEKKEELKEEIAELKEEEVQQQGESSDATSGQVAGEKTSKVAFIPGSADATTTIVPASKGSSRRLFKEFYLLLISTLAFVLKHKLIMYFVLIVMIYNVIKMTLRLAWRRRSY